ncbi:hypothetical protein CLV71_106237 [Actinophytocola oryzae]|uniref:Uncharacterized protein n=2 Tax=Actinophytocola oryzae TaxID=502181 RepID=A0A4R7VN00_9PSEU|nr:hypothetical protein CLV71_106237 [Actinophytocola oryzae]
MTLVATPVTLLRAAAGVLGLYGYGIGLWLARQDLNPEPVATIREWVNRPLGLGEDFGPFALMLLLLCTGFTVRQVVPLAVATGLAAVVAVTGLTAWTMPGGMPLVPLAWLTVLQLVAWLVSLDRLVWPSTVVVLAATVGTAVLTDLPELARPLEFLPLALIGTATWRVLDRTIPAWAGVLLGACCLGAVVAVDENFPGLDRWWYPVAATIAVLVFLVAVRPGRTADAIAANPVTRALSASAEWFVLVGPVVLFAVLGQVT